MYIEQRPTGTAGWTIVARRDWRGHILTTGRTVYFKGKSFRRLKVGPAELHMRRTGDQYWISGVKKRGTNRHWAGGGPIKGAAPKG
jgi:hypothetical protein